MNILILGGGGREHSLAWAALQNPKCDRLIAAPGNAGIAGIAECAALDVLDASAVTQFAVDESVDFVIVGPEAPLVAGVADRLREAGILCLGPSARAARLESSKGFAKEICAAAGVPTAAWARFDEAGPALEHVRSKGAPIVVKADGLAAGKGVVVAETRERAEAAVLEMFDGAFGDAGSEVVIEDFLEGEEASLFALCDGTDALEIGTAQDHKRVGDGDAGPNTGGMGAYSPAPVLSAEVEARAMREIVRPALAEMAQRGTPFQGVLYAGLMISDGAPKLVEFNARFGDPECQVLMMRLGGQALDLMHAAAEGRLEDVRANWADDHAMTVVMAAGGYPGSYAKGMPVLGLEGLPDDSFRAVFHAGTAIRDGQVVTDGGRVLNVAARGSTLSEARARAYGMVEAVGWDGAHWRTDIGWRALARADLDHRPAIQSPGP